MKILNITVSEFSGLGRRSYNLSEGLNIIEGLNESGKSSLLAFIKFALYGFSRRSSGEELGERERYVSWNGKRAAGSLTLIAEGRIWRIERELYIQTRSTRESAIENVKIIDVETGSEEHSGKVPGELFLGIPVDVFTSTCGIAQSNISAINSAEVGSSIENLLFSADENLSAEKASERLEAARRQLLHKNEKSGRLVDLRSERNTLRNRLSSAATAAKNMIAKEAMAGEYKRQADEARIELEKLEEAWEISELSFTLGRFEELRALEKKRAEYAASQYELEKNSFPDGFIPDRQYVAKLGALSRDLNSAESELSRAESELVKLENTIPYDIEKIKTAEFLISNASHSTDSVIAVYSSLKKSVKSPKTTGLFLLLLGGAAAVAGISLLILTLIFPGIISLALGAVIVTGGILSYVLSGKKLRKLNEYLNKLNFSADPGKTNLKTYIESCFLEVENKKQYSELLSARRGVVSVRRKQLSTVLSECRSELKKSGSDDIDENIQTAIFSVAELASAFCSQRESLIMHIQHTDSDIVSLRNYLMKFDEPLLRRKVENITLSEPITSEDYKKRRLELMSSVKAAEDKQHSTENELAALGATTENPRRLALQLEQLENLLNEMQLKYDAVKLAGESLSEAAGQLRRGVTPMLKNTAGELMGKLTGGRYDDLGVGQDMTITVKTDGITRPLAAMSGGTRDVAYISLRIALATLLCRKEKPPLFIDEGLSQLDDIRTANFIGMLSEWCGREGGQCIIFTCHSREAVIAGEKAKHILL